MSGVSPTPGTTSYGVTTNTGVSFSMMMTPTESWMVRTESSPACWARLIRSSAISARSRVVSAPSRARNTKTFRLPTDSTAESPAACTASCTTGGEALDGTCAPTGAAAAKPRSNGRKRIDDSRVGRR